MNNQLDGKKQPHFVGIFRRDAIRSVFYLTVDDCTADPIPLETQNPLTGIVEDKFGTASIEGLISANTIQFTKRYDPKQSSKDAYSGDIVFDGRRLDEHSYEGKYSLLDGKTGDFFMTKYHPSEIMGDNLNQFRLSLDKRLNS